MKKALRWLGAIILILVLLAVTIIVAGLIPIKASSGHWPITAWMLEFAMERSVSTHSSGIVAPPLDNEALIVRGASHYEVGCLWCHGGPNSEQPRVPLQMTPHPPNLTSDVKKWEPEELFYIVRHGVKFTGMPGWPTQHRDDEVWAVVAFLQRFPELNIQQYHELSGSTLRNAARQTARLAPSDDFNSTPPPSVVIERCVACHGADGQGRNAHPKLAGQWPEYLSASLRAYRAGQRHSGIMGPIAGALSDAEIQQAVEYYQALDRGSGKAASGREEIIAQGQLIAVNGLVKERAGACNECHGRTDSARNRRYPKLAGQNQGYLVQQLHLFRSSDRGGTNHAHIMQNIAESMSNEQIAAVAAYYAQDSLPSESRPVESRPVE